ncbi:MAG: hypothetical protein [Wendovervirus sonii]|uniref:Uncharacterized protein n=1 Tax=phage Lak_Megaphage_Sonny TaxID=3109229 RepID=A0ABZ0Z4R6_9CAUD|nr:MAG: hypothetical protein [phage Lak_Megaphage_Sonny]
MRFIILFLAYLPIVIAVVGFIMWIIPRKKTYIDSLSFRQIIGKLLFFIGLILSIAHFGASHHSTLFEQCGEDSVYCYRFLALPKDTVYANNDSLKSDITYLNDNDSIFYIPFEESNGVKHIKLKAGNAVINAIFDTGCSYAIVMTVNDYYKLVGAGVIKENEFTESTHAIIANGDSVDIHMFTLPECMAGNIRLSNIHCGVANNCPETLVGNSIFQNADVTIDNVNKQLIVKI